MVEGLINEIIGNLLQWQVWVYVTAGVFIGLTLGAIPGLTGSMGIGIILPFTMYLPTVQAMALLIGIYKSSMFGGSISAICFGTPGTPAASADVADGYPLTKQGKSKKAIQIALYSSVIADISSDIVLIAIVVPLAKLALLFGSRELLALMLLSLVSIIMFVRQSPLKGIISLTIGFLIATIGADPMSVVRRFTFGFRPLASGVDLVPFVLGIFAVSELFVQTTIILKDKAQGYLEKKREFKLSKENLTFRELISCWKEIMIGFIIGTFLGALPGPGSTLAAYTSYATAARFSKNKEQFGKGAIEGLAAAEAGNSATCGATFIPLFAFGIPGSAMAGLFMGAFMLQGITPGPTMFIEHIPVMYTIFIVIILANFFNLLIGYFLSTPFAYLASAPKSILVPFLLLLSSLGVYAYNNSTFDVVLVIVIGIIGYIMRMNDYPLAPALLGFILAPMIEKHFRRMMTINNNPLFFFESPIAMGLVITTIIVAFVFAYSGKPQKL